MSATATAEQTYTLDYAPTARQQVFHACAADEALYGGAAGGGKSTALAVEAILHCCETPGGTAVLFRRTFPELNAPGGLIQEVEKWMPHGLVKKVGLRWAFPNGATLTLAHCQHPQDVEKYKGAQFSFLGIDEAGDWLDRTLLFLFGRARTTLPGVQPRIRLTANPIGVGFAFLKKRYVKPVLLQLVAADQTWRPEPTEDKPRPATRCFIPAKHYDNPHLDPGYVGRLQDLPAADRAAMLDGSWELMSFAGQLFAAQYIEAAYESATGFAPAQSDGRQYLKLWDLANSADWMVNVTLDPNVMPAQIVRFDRYRRRGWRENAADIARVHAAYPGETIIDATGAGEVLNQFLDVPATPVVWHHGNKREAIRRLQILFERGGIAGPVSGNGADQPHDDENGIEHLWDELLQYRWDDKDLVQDCVTTLALGALRLEVPRRTVGATAFVPGGASTPLDDVDVDPLLAHASTLRAQMTVRPDHARRAHV